MAGFTALESLEFECLGLQVIIKVYRTLTKGAFLVVVVVVVVVVAALVMVVGCNGRAVARIFCASA